MRPISSLRYDQARRIRAVLFDIDDTITEDGYLLAESYQALWRLQRAGLTVVPVTGRPAGWCDLIARQWPVSGVVGENGAFAFYQKAGTLHRIFHPLAPEPGVTRIRLDELGKDALHAFPALRLAKDQAYRLFDLALDFAEEEPRLGLPLAGLVKEFCESRGATAKISSIHVNAWFGAYDKLSMAEHFLSSTAAYDPKHDESSVLYVGDSPNDEPMFQRFSLSCGVANVRNYAHLIHFLPKYVTSKPYGYGFAETVDVLLALLENR